MKIIIQCSGTKNGIYWKSSKIGGKAVKFVAHPDICEETKEYFLAKPDEKIPNENITWREFLIWYNEAGTNPDGLLKAGDLYAPEIYKELLRKFGWEDMYILSAGWGLIRSSFYLPNYNITFAQKAPKYAKRSKTDWFDDFNQLKDTQTSSDESIYFFGGKDYIHLFYTMTRDIRCMKVIYNAADLIDNEKGYEYIHYYSKIKTNWHYACSEDFIRGNIAR